MKIHTPVHSSGKSAVAARAEKPALTPHPHGAQATPQLAVPLGVLHDFSRMALPLNHDRPNRTGLPDRLKAGLEELSGLAMDEVRVSYNSPEPAKLQALAYAQGTDIHVGPGQERHLPHETWHVVQQKQGRVKPTLQMKGKAINDDGALEREADRMGTQAGHALPPGTAPPLQVSSAKNLGGGAHAVTAAQDGRSAGSVKLHQRGGGKIEVTDLGVDAPHRGGDVGRRLLDSALRAGFRLGGRSVSLDADDNGSGRLVNWYQKMGFSRTGIRGNAGPRLEAPIGKVLGAVAQRKIARPMTGPAKIVQRAAAAVTTTATATAAAVTEADLIQWCKGFAETVSTSKSWKTGKPAANFVTLLIPNQLVGGAKVDLTFHIHIKGSDAFAGSLYGAPNVKVSSQEAPELKYLVASWQDQNKNKAAKTPELLAHKSQQIAMREARGSEQAYRTQFDDVLTFWKQNTAGSDEAFVDGVANIVFHRSSPKMVEAELKDLKKAGSRDEYVKAYLKHISGKFKKEQEEAGILTFKIVDLYADAKL
jgi:ribosomal protein S18 acetylase RimI-like enzyme